MSKIANEKFLEHKAQEEGIKALESGIPAPPTEDFLAVAPDTFISTFRLK